MQAQPALQAALRGALCRRPMPLLLSSKATGSTVPAAAALGRRPWQPARMAAAAPAPPRHCFSTAAARLSAAQPSSPSSSEPAVPVLPASVLPALFSSSPAAAAAATATGTAAAPFVPLSVGPTNAHPTVYATVHIHGRPYLVTPGDSLRLPFRMPGVQPGDELRLDRVGVVGNRTVTAIGQPAEAAAEAEAAETAAAATIPAAARAVPYVPGASVRAVVLGVETEPMRTLVKTKRRQRKKRTVKSKHQFTVLRIQDVVVEEP